MKPTLRSVLAAGVAGSAMVSAAWAGVVLAPVPEVAPPPVAVPSAPVHGATGAAGAMPATAASPAPLGKGQALVGAAKRSIAPRPGDMRERFPGARWETDAAKCRTLDRAFLDRLRENAGEELDHLAAPGSPWPENPNCIYMGGFGIGPVNPVTAFDTEHGLWVRSVAVGDGADTVVLTVVDGEGWFWDYASKCAECGAKQIAQSLSAELGLPPASFVLHATHSHAAPDFIGGWGFVPTWYLQQVTDTIKQTVRDAVTAMEPAVLEVGEQEARSHNAERRDTYRAAEEQQLAWVRALAAEPAEQPRVIATLGSYAAHPTTKGTNGTVAHPDWPGLFERRLEERFGGVGLHFMSGLGNVSARGGTAMGRSLADLVPPVGAGRTLTDTDVRVRQATWRQPLTNVPLDALGTPGFFDRRFDAEPATLRTGERPDTAPCTSAAPQSAELPATAAAVGDGLVFTAAPGEVFSNLTNTIKDKAPGRVVLPIGQANDALGYMPQSFELNPVGQQALGFVVSGILFVNYEDSYAVDRCVGDMVLETTLGLLAELGAR